MRYTSNSLRTFIIAVVAIGLILLALSGFFSPLSRTFLNPVVSAQTWIATRYYALKSFLNSPQDNYRIQQEFARLELENAHLKSRLIELEQQMAETHLLTALLDFARAYPDYKYTTASVIGRDPSPFLQYILINQGSDSGIQRGMPVVTEKGLIGRVERVTAAASSIQLITNSDSILNVHLEPSGVEGVLHGLVTGDLSVEMIPQSADVNVGDLVMSSGLGGSYPPNILIGQVSSVRSRDYDLFQTASVQALVDFNDLKIVLIITNFNPIDLSPLLTTPSQ